MIIMAVENLSENENDNSNVVYYIIIAVCGGVLYYFNKSYVFDVNSNKDPFEYFNYSYDDKLITYQINKGDEQIKLSTVKLEISLASKGEEYEKFLKFSIKSGCIYEYVCEFYTGVSFDVTKDPIVDYVVHENGHWGTYNDVQKMGIKKIRAIIDAYNIIEKK